MIDRGETQRLDTVKWVIIAILIVGGIYANHYYATQPLSLRLIGWITLGIMVAFIAAMTVKGKTFIDYAKEARVEIRKVVWPTRQETVQTTLVVVAMVAVMSLLLWGMDSVLLWMVGFLTGQLG